MTTKRTYQCNFCGDKIEQAVPGNPPIAFGGVGIGVRWLAQDLEIRQMHECENHLCLRCLRAIQKLSTPSPPEGQ